jgi:O-antigen biosynthesis protein WbqP
MKKSVYIPIKSVIDRVTAGVMLLLLSPVFAGLCIAVAVSSPGPVFFKQKRVGIYGSYFQILKFRTMRTDTPSDVPTHQLEDPEKYITKVGAFLRRTSLDELPQLINILKGDMAFVGPRPALWNQYDLVEEREKYGANDILPGLTGWAQINGRDELEIPLKAKYDGFYARHMGPILDIVCLMGTLISVIEQKGVVEGGTGAMKKPRKEHEIKITINLGPKRGGEDTDDAEEE